jgi:hypothetical protein
MPPDTLISGEKLPDVSAGFFYLSFKIQNQYLLITVFSFVCSGFSLYKYTLIYYNSKCESKIK